MPGWKNFWESLRPVPVTRSSADNDAWVTHLCLHLFHLHNSFVFFFAKQFLMICYQLLCGKPSDLGEHDVIWHQRNQASSPATADKTANGGRLKIQSGVCGECVCVCACTHTHTHTNAGSLCILFPESETKLGVMRCTHDLWKHLLPISRTCFLLLPDRILRALLHMLFWYSKTGKIKETA